MEELLLVVYDRSWSKELNVLERVFAHVTHLPATPLRSTARATLTQWHTFRAQGGGAKPRSSDVTGEPLQRSRCTEHGGGWRLSGGPAACARVPWKSAWFCIYLSNDVVFLLQRTAEALKRKSFPHPHVFRAICRYVAHTTTYRSWDRWD